MAEPRETPHREPAGPSAATIKRLFALSGNRCAFPRCPANIVQGDTVVGEICHIKAKKPDGPRYDAQQSVEERHSYSNLIMLCGSHHTVIDDDTESCSVDRLVKMKSDHEQRAASMPTEIADRGAKLLIDQSVTGIGQSGGITAHTININSVNIDGSDKTLTSTLAASPSEPTRSAYIEDLKRTAKQVVHSQMTLEGRFALRHLMVNEPIEVGRTFLEIPQERLHEQLGIAKRGGVVQHRVVAEGARRTYWIINPQFRSVLEEVLYSDSGVT